MRLEAITRNNEVLLLDCWWERCRSQCLPRPQVWVAEPNFQHNKVQKQANKHKNENTLSSKSSRKESLHWLTFKQDTHWPGQEVDPHPFLAKLCALCPCWAMLNRAHQAMQHRPMESPGSCGLHPCLDWSRWCAAQLCSSPRACPRCCANHAASCHQQWCHRAMAGWSQPQILSGCHFGW